MHDPYAPEVRDPRNPPPMWDPITGGSIKPKQTYPGLPKPDEPPPELYAQDISELELSVYGFLPDPPAGTSEAVTVAWHARHRRLE